MPIYYSREDTKDSKLNLYVGIARAYLHQIEIDGGITPETAPLMAAAGADVLVAGSAVFKGGLVQNPAPYGDNIRAIRAAAKG